MASQDDTGSQYTLPISESHDDATEAPDAPDASVAPDARVTPGAMVAPVAPFALVVPSTPQNSHLVSLASLEPLELPESIYSRDAPNRSPGPHGSVFGDEIREIHSSAHPHKLHGILDYNPYYQIGSSWNSSSLEYTHPLVQGDDPNLRHAEQPSAASIGVKQGPYFIPPSTEYNDGNSQCGLPVTCTYDSWQEQKSEYRHGSVSDALRLGTRVPPCSGETRLSSLHEHASSSTPLPESGSHPSTYNEVPVQHNKDGIGSAIPDGSEDGEEGIVDSNTEHTQSHEEIGACARNHVRKEGHSRICNEKPQERERIYSFDKRPAKDVSNSTSSA